MMEKNVMGICRYDNFQFWLACTSMQGILITQCEWHCFCCVLLLHIICCLFPQICILSKNSIFLIQILLVFCVRFLNLKTKIYIHYIYVIELNKWCKNVQKIHIFIIYICVIKINKWCKNGKKINSFIRNRVMEDQASFLAIC